MPRKKKSNPLGSKSKSFPKNIVDQRKLLPIFGRKSDLLKLVAENQIVIVTGETGSGKTTQIPQYLAEADYASKGCIGCTLPWRIAASSVATRVSEEYGCKVGQQVGFAVRFENCTSKHTIIKYMTDGILVSECVRDPELKKYSVVIIDEAHGRTASTDLLFGMVKNAVSKRKNLKLIVCSATLDEGKFSTYFAGAPILDIPGRLFPVEVAYTNDKIIGGRGLNLEPFIKLLIKIHRTDTAGDVLVFLPGQDDIERLCAFLQRKLFECPTFGPKPVVLPLYGALEPYQQKRVFEKTPNNRKIIVATNIAESSLTIDGIVYVIDSGLVKQKIYRPKTGADEFKVCEISQAQAKQRAGRAGRTAAGKCFRLYSEADFNSMTKSNAPELLRCNLASVVLTLKHFGIKDVFEFPFMDAPPNKSVVAAIYHLMLLGALESDQSITHLGKKISGFPVEPCLAKFLIVSEEMGCLPEALTVVSMMSVQDQQKLYYSPMGRRAIAAKRRASFFQPEGDHFTLLEVYEEWRDYVGSSQWCMDNFVSIHGLKEAQRIRRQLVFLMRNRKLLDVYRTCGNDSEVLQKALCAAFFYNVAKKQDKPPHEVVKYEYSMLGDGQMAHISLSSSVFEGQPDYIVFHSLIQSKHTLMHEVASIMPEWLAEVAPEFFVKDENDSEQISATNKFAALKQAAGFESDELTDSKIVTGSSPKELEIAAKKESVLSVVLL